MSSAVTLLKTEAGVRLERVRVQCPLNRSTYFRISTLRARGLAVFAELTEAEEAFEREVRASMTDPEVSAVLSRIRAVSGRRTTAR